MADQEHLNLIKQGIYQGNEWREQNPNTTLDLSGANLSGADFNGASLWGTNFSGADLSGADLSATDLHIADLSGANLSETNLYGANFNMASLSGADLSNAIMGYTQIGDHDLRKIKGLETIKHEAPSSLSINTVYSSEGDIPEAFVRGTGAPDTFIEYMRTLVAKPINHYTCFISYSSKDHAFAERLHHDLQGNAVRCWFAKKDLQPGDFYRDKIDKSIRMYDKVILILSEHSVKSAWVEQEVEQAWEREAQPTEPGAPLVLFPIRIDDTVMKTKCRWASQLRFLRHIGDFTNWKDYDTYQAHFQQLLLDLKTTGKKQSQ